MENKAEDEIRKRWELETSERQGQDDRSLTRPRKRPRELEDSAANNTPPTSIFGRIMSSMSQENIGIGEIPLQMSNKGKSKVRNGNGSRSRSANPTRAAAAKSRSRVTELLEADGTMGIIDVD